MLLRRFGQGVLAVLILVAGCSLIAPFDEVKLGPDGSGGSGGSSSGGSGGTGGSGGGCDACPASTDCVEWHCNAGSCEMSFEDTGALCDDDGGLYCHEGECVRCILDDKKSSNETDVDCGGVECPPCADYMNCNVDTDCESKVCVDICAAPTCIDDVKNGDETGTDCSAPPPDGPCQQLCQLGEGCNTDDDCDPTLFCSGGNCCATACEGLCRKCDSTGCSLIDENQDPQDECPGLTNYCDGNGACQSCSDLTLNHTETDFDCGGEVCPPCPEGRNCDVPEDCASCMCTDGVCTSPICNNGIKDGCESDVDCGGACGPICADGDDCNSKSDCGSGSCVDGKCVGP